MIQEHSSKQTRFRTWSQQPIQPNGTPLLLLSSPHLKPHRHLQTYCPCCKPLHQHTSINKFQTTNPFAPDQNLHTNKLLSTTPFKHYKPRQPTHTPASPPPPPPYPNPIHTPQKLNKTFCFKSQQQTHLVIEGKVSTIINLN